MVMTPSTMLPLGTIAPEFRLPDTNGKLVSLSDYGDAKGFVVMFICNHCPFVKHLRSSLAEFGKECEALGVRVIAISSNDVVSHPDDSPDKMASEKQSAGYTFPYLFDETQAVAKAYQAACTPDFYVFDADRKLVYRGQYDDSRPQNGLPVTGNDLRAAVNAVVAGQPVPEPQKPSIGCNIKWKPGNNPSYFA